MDTFGTKLENENNKTETNFNNFKRFVIIFFVYTKDWVKVYNKEK